MTGYQSAYRFPFPGRVFTVPALMLVALLSGCGKADLTEAEYMQRAKNYQDQGDLRASVIELKNVLTKNPNNPEARWLLGKVYVALESGAAAEKELVRARELGVDPTATAVPLGRALLLQGKAQQILDEIKVTESAPAAVRVGVLTLRGEANLGLGQTQTAQNDLSAALETCANSKCSDTLLALAKLAQRSGDPAKARDWIMKAAAQDPKNAAIWRNLGDLETSQNHRKEALINICHHRRESRNQII